MICAACEVMNLIQIVLQVVQLPSRGDRKSRKLEERRRDIEQAVLAEEEAVVGGEEGDGVFCQSFLSRNSRTCPTFSSALSNVR